jgi:hypothetical protein
MVLFIYHPKNLEYTCMKIAPPKADSDPSAAVRKAHFTQALSIRLAYIQLIQGNDPFTDIG